MNACCLKQIFSVALVLTSVIFVNAQKGGVNDALKENCLQLSGNTPACVSSCLSSCKQGNNKEDNCELMSKLISNLENISYNTIAIKESFINMLISESEIHENKLKRSFNCADLRAHGDIVSGVRTVYPYKCCPAYPVKVYCDQDTDGGGWTVFQKRAVLPIREKFSRDWASYSLGFGNPTGEHWLGLANIYELTNQVTMELRIDLEDYENEKRFAKYETFRIEDSTNNYKLRIGPFEGNLKDDFRRHDKKPFSTFDNDNDDWDGNCAEHYKGGWWFIKCHPVFLNGLAHVGKHDSYADGIHWQSWRGYYYSLKETTMMIRPAI